MFGSVSPLSKIILNIALQKEIKLIYELIYVANLTQYSPLLPPGLLQTMERGGGEGKGRGGGRGGEFPGCVC